MDMDDISKRKLYIEDLLQQEQQKLTDLTESLENADRLTNNMVSILTNFDERLLKLEETILPVHRKTKDLQRLQDNIEKTITSLDHVISYHHVARNVSSVLDKGPSRQVDVYIESMNNLGKAVQFFNENNPDSPELNTVTQLFDKGKDGLESEFKQQLVRQTKSVLPNQLIELEVDLENDAQILSDPEIIKCNVALPEQTMKDLSKIAKWLAEPGSSISFIESFASVRSDNLLHSLTLLKDHMLEIGENSGVRKVSAIKDTPKKAGGRRASTLGRRASSLLLRKESSQNVLGGTGRNSTFNAINEIEIVDIEVEPFNEIITCGVKLFAIEKALLHRIIPENSLKHSVFDMVIKASLEMINQMGMKIVQYARHCTLRHDHASIVNIFPVITHLKKKQPLYQAALRDCTESSLMKLPQLIGMLDSTGAKVLEDFTDSVKSDPEKESNMPKDGTVHELTSNAMLFMHQLALSVNAAGGMLAAQHHHETSMPKEKSRECLAQYISHVLGALKLNLENKSHVYLDEALAAIFLLNNYDFILTALHRSGILTLVQSYISDIEGIYKNVIQEQKDRYMASWKKFPVYLSLENKQGIVLNIQPGMKLKDREKAIVKDKFKSFNNDLDELVKLHRDWAMPSDEIRSEIRLELQDKIIPLYESFKDRFKLVQFTKNIEKFIKYSSEDAKRKIGSIFDQSATF